MFRTASSLLAYAALRMKARPTVLNLAEGLGTLGVFALSALAIHTLMSPIHFSIALPGLRNDPDAFLFLAAVALAIPALGEELVFRGILDPLSIGAANHQILSAMQYNDLRLQNLAADPAPLKFSIPLQTHSHKENGKTL